jgi:signal peptidase II
MTTTSRCHFITALLLALVLLVADQWSKEFIMEMVMAAPRFHIQVTDFFNLVVVWNYGISFGMLAGHVPAIALILLSLVIIAVLIHWLGQSDSWMVTLSIGAVIGGAVGNIIDRIRFGAVFDFLDFHLNGWHWPAFNIADASIFMGVVVLCAHSIFFERLNQPKDSNPN